MYNYPYSSDTLYNASSSGLEAGAGVMIWWGIAALLALIGGIVAYYLFVKPKKSYDNKFLAWLKEFLQFKKMWIEGLLKVFYIIGAIFTTLASFGFFGFGGFGVILFFVVLILGNVLLRIVYESAIIKIMIWGNTQDINNKLK